MNTIPHRIIVYTKDIVNITGRSERTARRILSTIRKENNKPQSSLVSMQEFCEYMCLKEEIIMPFLKWPFRCYGNSDSPYFFLDIVFPNG